MNYIEQKYKFLCKKPSDINEHLPTLYKYASECESIAELGVRGVISTWALLYGLLKNNKEKKTILLNDIVPCNINEVLMQTQGLEIQVNYEWKNDLHLELKENVDLTFIDTWHVYGQLRRELEKFSKVTNKYIIMHDTTLDEWNGETMRKSPHSMKNMLGRVGGYDYRKNKLAMQQSRESKIPMQEIMIGLWPAIAEFLLKNKNWKLKERYTNNNGLTILEKIK